MQEKPKIDWRDRTATKVIAAIDGVALLAAAIVGGRKLLQYQGEKFCQQYGWLRDKPSSVQTQAATEYAQDMAYNDSSRMEYRNQFMKSLRNCQ